MVRIRIEAVRSNFEVRFKPCWNGNVQIKVGQLIHQVKRVQAVVRTLPINIMMLGKCREVVARELEPGIPAHRCWRFSKRNLQPCCLFWYLLLYILDIVNLTGSRGVVLYYVPNSHLRPFCVQVDAQVITIDDFLSYPSYVQEHHRFVFDNFLKHFHLLRQQFFHGDDSWASFYTFSDFYLTPFLGGKIVHVAFLSLAQVERSKLWNY